MKVSRVIIIDDTGMKYVFYSGNQGIEVETQDGEDTLVVRQRPIGHQTKTEESEMSSEN